jgi:hypothetical protein
VTAWSGTSVGGLGSAYSVKHGYGGADLGRGGDLFSLNLFERKIGVKQCFHEKWVGHLL